MKTFSSIVMLKLSSFRLSIATCFDYEIWQMDVKTIFLKNLIEDTIYMEQPGWFINKDGEARGLQP